VYLRASSLYVCASVYRCMHGSLYVCASMYRYEGPFKP